MFRALAVRGTAVVRHGLQRQIAAPFAIQQRLRHAETDQEFDARYCQYFNRTDLDGWELRKGLTEVMQYDLVPDPTIINAALRACRRANEYALCIRFLESIRIKCGGKLNTIWPYILQEIKPTLDELGIETPEQLGYDKPELDLKDIYGFA